MGASTGGVIAESAFIVDDDGLLCDLMNLDSLSEQVGDDIVESWMDGSSCSDFNLTTFSEISCNEEGNSDPLDFSPSSDHSGSDHGQQPPVSFPPPRSPSLVGSGNIAMLLSDPSLSTMAAVEPFLTVPESLLCGNRGDVDEEDSQETSGLTSEEMKLVDEEETTRMSLRDRLVQAVRSIGRHRPDVLVQVWMPVAVSDQRTILSTREQPFALPELKSDDQRLWLFRSACENYEFESEQELGRVFVHQKPEWSPNVQMYSSAEYSRHAEARRCDVRASLCLPVLDACRCVAVIELAGNTEKVQFSPDVEIVSCALRAVELSSVTGLETPLPQRFSQARQAALNEIGEVLTAVSETHKLPLAQTWVPSCGADIKVNQSGGSCKQRSCCSSQRLHLRTGDGPCYVSDPRVWGFRHACVEHSLEKGQGAPGRAFESNQPSFESDVKSRGKREYPPAHYAKWFGLGAAVAIRLRSIHTGSDDFILEFFLPASCLESQEQQLLLNSLSITMQRTCRSLRTVTDKELEDEQQQQHVLHSGDEEPSCIDDDHCRFDPHTPGDEKLQTRELHPVCHHNKDSNLMGSPLHTDNATAHDAASARRRHDRRRATTEKTIDLTVLQRYFAGSLKDAAKSIGVCPTTLKRICRKHGISRWPSRKINKVSRSLKHLQGVIDSVQGADGSLRINALTWDILNTSLSKDDDTSTCTPPGSWSTLSYDFQEPLKPDTLLVPKKESEQSRIHDESCSRLPEHKIVLNRSGRDSSPADSLSDLGKSYPETDVVVTCMKASISQSEDVSNSDTSLHATTRRTGSDCSSSGPESSIPSSEVPWPSVVTMKVTCDQDTVRFKFAVSEKGCRIDELREEVNRRLNMNEAMFDLKYLDDDNEWMLLACDADLQECLEVWRASSRSAINLMVRCKAATPDTGSSPKLHWKSQSHR